MSCQKSRFLSSTAHFLLIFYYFHLLSSAYIYFRPFSLIFIDFPDFPCFRSSLFVFDCFYPNLRVTAYFYLFLLYHFRLFSFIFCYIWPSRLISDYLYSKFYHFQQFTVTLTHLNCFSSYIHKYELVYYICYYLYLTNDTYFWFLQFIYYLFL